jgi:hypothetical protein
LKRLVIDRSAPDSYSKTGGFLNGNPFLGAARSTTRSTHYPPKQAIVSFNAGSSLTGLSQIMNGTSCTIVQSGDEFSGRFAVLIVRARIHQLRWTATIGFGKGALGLPNQAFDNDDL